MKSNVVKLRPEIELDDELEFDINQTDFDDGDGGGSDEIVIRVIHEYPENEAQEPELHLNEIYRGNVFRVIHEYPENEEKEPESKSSGIAPFIYGALIGWWLG